MHSVQPLIHTHDKTLPIRSLLNTTGVQHHLDLKGTTEVAINRPGELWTEMSGRWTRHERPALTFEVCTQLANALAVQVADSTQTLTKQSPITPVELPDGQRGQIVMPPATERGCISFTFRVPSEDRFDLASYRDSGRLSDRLKVRKNNRTELYDFEKEMLVCMDNGDFYRFFQLAVKHKLNMIFGGRTGSGKTTFAKAIVDLYPTDRRYITIEDVAELSMPNHPNRVHLFYGNHLSAISVVQSCMRMKGDHIFMSELKGDETWSYINLLNTGHDGSLTTGHFNNCDSAVPRLTSLVKQSPVGMTLPHEFIYKTIQSSIDIVCMWEGSYMTEIKYDPIKKLQILNGENV